MCRNAPVVAQIQCRQLLETTQPGRVSITWNTGRLIVDITSSMMDKKVTLSSVISAQRLDLPTHLSSRLVSNTTLSFEKV